MILKLINLTKKFFPLRGQITALNDINLEIQDKEFFVLLGPSGCGKSTLLNLIAGLEKPTSGEVWYNDRLVASTKKRVFLMPKDRNVAFVFQSYALYPHLNVFENIAFPLRIIGTKQRIIKEAVEKVASTLGISSLLAAKPGELSGGQRQRVAIARAIVRHPTVLLLDEPLSNLDAQLRLSMRAELKNLQRKLGITTIYVTHDQVEAMTLGDRIGILKDGKLEQMGTPNELYERPINTFVATFIGSPPMNLLETSFIEEEGIFYIILGDRKVRTPANKTKDLKKLKAKSCILGIRPEHIYISPVRNKPSEATVPLRARISNGVSQSFKAKIDSLEPLGREMLLHILLNKYKCSVLTPDTGFKEGEIVDVELDLRKVHIFEI
ncbi:MAG: ABC transporter ATP-binding protein [bacterium]